MRAKRRLLLLLGVAGALLLWGSSPLGADAVASFIEGVSDGTVLSPLRYRQVQEWKWPVYTKEQLDLPLLVNPDHPLERDYIPDKLSTVGKTDWKMTPDAAKAAGELLEAAKKDGFRKLTIKSAYRDFNYQKKLYDAKVAAYRGRYGADAERRAARVVAKPGTSEHQTGLAMDIAVGALEPVFGKSEEGKWLSENAHLYGFVVRYPEDKTDITGISYEPWHLRYVGTEHAKAMIESGLCLEEYIEKVQSK